MSISEHNDEIKEIRSGDGGYIIDDSGEILPPYADFESSDPEPEPHLYDDEANWPESETTAEKAETQQKRYRDFKNEFGFYPSSTRELNYACGVGGIDAARYLNIILLHQKAISEVETRVPAKTLLNIESKFISYKNAAVAEVYFIGEFGVLLQESDLLDDETVKYDTGAQRAIVDILRNRDIDNFVNGKNTKSKVKIKKYSEYLQEVAEFITSERDKDKLIYEIEAILEQQRERQKFWTERIKESAKHSIVSALAKRALGQTDD